MSQIPSQKDIVPRSVMIAQIARLESENEQLRSRLDEVEKANAEACERMKDLMLFAPPLSTRWQQTINACINILALKNPPESGSEVRG